MKPFKSQKGQTSIEYILLVSVMFTVGMTFFDKFQGYLIDNPDSLINNYLNTYKQVFGDPNSSGTTMGFKRFPLRQ